jgi:hypothetical protein
MFALVRLGVTLPAGRLLNVQASIVPVASDDRAAMTRLALISQAIRSLVLSFKFPFIQFREFRLVAGGMPNRNPVLLVAISMLCCCPDFTITTASPR